MAVTTQTRAQSVQATRDAAPKTDKRGPSFAGGAEGMGALVATIAVMAALAVTAIAILAEWAPQLQPIPMTQDMQSNLVVGVLFFWLELFTLIIGLRLLDANRARANRKRHFATIFKRLTQLGEECYDLRYQFALALDNSLTRNVYFNTDVNQMNAGLRKLREEMVAFMFDLDPFGALEGKIFDRIMRSMDMMVGDSFNLSLEAEALTDQIKAKLEPLPVDQPAPVEVTALRTQLDTVMQKLLDCARSERSGIEGIQEAIQTLTMG